MSLDDFKRDIRRQLTETKLINKEIESKINITDAQIADLLSAHKADFNLIEPQYHLAQIVVTTAPAQQAGNLQNNKATGDADAKKKIDALYSRLESGQDFATVAMNFSEDPNTASNGGDMGFVPGSRSSRPIRRSTTRSASSSRTSSPMSLPDLRLRPGAQDRRLRDLQADCARAGRAAGAERSPRAAGHPPDRCTTTRSNCCRTPTSRCCRTMPGCATTSPTDSEAGRAVGRDCRPLSELGFDPCAGILDRLVRRAGCIPARAVAGRNNHHIECMLGAFLTT